MASNQIKQLMESMGWTDGTFIPIANEENKALMQSMQESLNDKEKKLLIQQNLNDKLANFQKHYAEAEQDIRHNSTLINAHRLQVNDEINMRKVSENEYSGLRKRIKELKSNVEETSKYDNKTQKDICKMQSAIESLSQKINWYGVALKEWSEGLSRGEEAIEMITKYCVQDEHAAFNLENKRSLLEENINKQRNLLIGTYKELKNLETVLQRTSKLYRQAHQEKKRLINNWKEAVDVMNSRIAEIRESNSVIDEAKDATRKKYRELKEQEEFYHQQIENNHEIERAIAKLSEFATRARHQLGEISEVITLKTNDFISLKKTIQNASNQLQQQRQLNRQKIAERSEKEEQIENGKENHEKHKEKYMLFLNRNMSAQERLKHIDELFDAEEKNVKAIAEETTRLGDMLYRSQQTLSTWKSDYKVYETEESGIQSEIVGLKKGQSNERVEIKRQTEMLYNLELQITNLHTRLAKIGGDKLRVSSEIQNRLNYLEQLYQEKMQQHQTVKLQALKVEEDLRKMAFEFGEAALELEKVEGKIKGIKLQCEGGEKLLHQTTLQYQERLVEKSLLKMRLNQLESMVRKQSDKIFSLEKCRADTELAVNERMVNIKTQKDILQMKRKHLMEELAQLRADVGERNLKISASIKRYESAVELLGKNDDGTEITATQIKIETALMKEELLRDGNELNDKVITAEKDIKAIENTLLLLNFSNGNYKKSLEFVEEDNKDMTYFQDLNFEYCRLLQELKKYKQQLMNVTQEILELEKHDDNLLKALESIKKSRLDNSDVLAKINKELFEQKNKLERANSELKQARKCGRQKVNKDFFRYFENDIRLKELENINNMSLQKLADMVDGIIGMGPVVSKHLCEKGISIPQSSRQRSVGSRSDTSVKPRSGGTSAYSKSSERLHSSSNSSVSSRKSSNTHVASIVALEFNPDLPLNGMDSNVRHY